MKRLKRYLPFIDFVIEKRPEIRDKFQYIKRTIRENKRVGKTILKKTEGALKFQYNNLKKLYKIPAEIEKLFEIKQYDLVEDYEDSDVEIVEDAISPEAQRPKEPYNVPPKQQDNLNAVTACAGATPNDKCLPENNVIDRHGEKVTECRPGEPHELALQRQENLNVVTACLGTTSNDKHMPKNNVIDKQGEKVSIYRSAEPHNVALKQQDNINIVTNCAGATSYDKRLPKNNVSHKQDKKVTECRPDETHEVAAMEQQVNLNVEAEFAGTTTKNKCSENEKIIACTPKKSDEVPPKQVKNLNLGSAIAGALSKGKSFPEIRINKENEKINKIRSDNSEISENEPLSDAIKKVNSLLAEKNCTEIETIVLKNNANTKKTDSDVCVNNNISSVGCDDNFTEMNFMNLEQRFTELSSIISIGEKEINDFVLAFPNPPSPSPNIPKVSDRDPRINKLFAKTSNKANNLLEENNVSKPQQVNVKTTVSLGKETKIKKRTTGNEVRPETIENKRSKNTEKNISLRELLSLECTFKGFNDRDNFSIRGRKRRSSISARSAIALQFGSAIDINSIESETNDSNDESRSNPKSLNKTPPKRRKSINSIQDKSNDIPEQLDTISQEKEPLLTRIKSTTFIEQVKKKKTNTTLEVANTDINMTENNTKTCILCKAHAHNLTYHFIRFHKAESYTSRLTVKQINRLKSPLTLEERSYRLVNQKYQLPCIFCNEDIDNIILYDHLSMHTGEYAYQCSGCKMQKPFRLDIENHQRSSKYCGNSRLGILYRYLKNQLVIYIYSCEICNFVQLNEANVLRHLRIHHQIVEPSSNINQHVAKYILATVKHDEENIQVRNEAYQAVMDTVDEPYDMTFEETKENILLFAENTLEEHRKSEDFDYNETSIDSANSSLSNVYSVKYRLYNNVEYFGLYKCVDLECFFSTDSSEEIFNHINEHIPTINQENGFDCYYCGPGKHFSTISAFIQHVTNHHALSRFQCSTCIYRSYSPDSVLIHYQNAHGDSKNIAVYECYGKIISTVNRMPHMINSMMNNIQKLQCSYCEMSFYTVSILEDHILTTHSKSNEEHDFPMFACIYCGENFKEINVIREHIALEHPDELVYACERILRVGFMDDLLKNLIMTDISQPLSSEYIVLKKQDNKADISEKIDNKLDLLENIKPNEKDIEKIHIDMIRPLLWEIASKSGVPPDRIFCCSACSDVFLTYECLHSHLIKNHCCCIMLCPHCMIKTELDFSNSKECKRHLEQHIMHLWLCFHCSYTYKNECDLRCHAKTVHKEENNEILEEITLNELYSFKVYAKKELNANRLDFLMKLKNVLEIHLKAKQTIIPTQWMLSANNQFLEYFPKYCYTETALKLCFFKNCSFKTKDTDDLFKHVNANHPSTKELYCSKCFTNITSNGGWEEYEQHFKCHFSKLQVCTLCHYYNYDRQCVINHIKAKHSQRDTVLITLIRSKNNTHMCITLVLGQNKLCLSSISGCFVEDCEEKNLMHNKFIAHLNQSHNIQFQYFCEICNEYFQNSEASENHFKSKHMSEQFALQLELSTYYNVDLVSANPLKLRINSNEQLLNTKVLSQVKEEVVEEQCNHLVIPADLNKNNRMPIKCVDINKLL